mgnify:CR=1 FL=1
MERTKSYITEKHTCKECGHTRVEMIPVENLEIDMSIHISSAKRGYKVLFNFVSKNDFFPNGLYHKRETLKEIFELLPEYLTFCEEGKGISLTSDNHSLVIQKQMNSALIDEILSQFKKAEKDLVGRWFEPLYRRATRQHSRIKKI